jgi:hypothetical protein
MAGLNLGAGAQVKSSAQVNYGSVPSPTTSMAAGFGIDNSNGGDAGIGALSPNDPAGVVFWWGIAATALLLALYYSLPA